MKPEKTFNLPKDWKKKPHKRPPLRYRNPQTDILMNDIASKGQTKKDYSLNELVKMEDTSNVDSFLGLGKGAKNRREDRSDRKAARTDEKRSRAEVLRAEAYATRTLADQGISYHRESGVGQIGKGILGAIGGKKGEAEQDGADSTENNANTQQWQKDKPQKALTTDQPDNNKPGKVNWLLIGGCAVIIIVVLFMVLKKKK